MKKHVVILLLFSLLLSGCSFFGHRIMEPVTFYYLQANYTYGRNPGLIASEQREASGHLGDLSYLLALYLLGPAEEDHLSPLPPDTQITNVKYRGDTVSLNLIVSDDTLTEPELTLAYACLTLTCLDITDAQQVKITYQDQAVTMTRDMFTLTDNTNNNFTTEEVP